MNSLPVDIAILPDDTLQQKAISLSEDLQSEGTLFTLRNDSYFAHISLYMTQLRTEDPDKVKTLLMSIAGQSGALELKADGYQQPEGYLDANYVRIKELDELQMRVINAINPIREGMREKDKKRLLEATGKSRENLEKYGYRGIGELFRPHMTFTRFADSQSRDVGKLPLPNEFSGKFVSLGLFEMGDNGTCKRKIAEFNLGGN